VFAVAWGERAVELLERDAVGAGHSIERAGEAFLAVTGAIGAADRAWRCWLSGRLTNGEDLCARLGLPAGSSNAEVAARACARLGIDACGLLRGTFVLVAFEQTSGRGAVVRDQLGGRPLLESRVGNGALFAEHERTITDLLPSAPGPDRLALAQWIEQGRTPTGRTLFAGIERIGPGCRALLDGERPVTVERYWQPRYGGTAAGSYPDLCEQLREAAFAAIARAAQGAKAPALLLSGGLDSSCVAAGLAARPALPGETSEARAALALSGVFPSRPETDERELIEASARHTGLAHELVAFDESASILSPALEHLDRWRLPPVTPNLFAWQPVMARARELGVDAMLDGEGGDELFGFACQLIADRLRAGRLLAAWRLSGRIPGVGAEADMRMRVRALRVYGTGRLLPAAARRRRTLRRSLRSTRSLLRREDELGLSELEHETRVRWLDGPLWWRGLAERLAQPGETVGVAAHMRREAEDERIDRRHPFLFDLDLLSVVLQTPPQLLFEMRDRALLRDGLRGHIPEAVRGRTEKSVFNGLLDSGLVADGETLVAGAAREDSPVRAFVRPERLRLLLAQASRPRDGGAARRLWQVGLADVWLRSLECPQYPLALREQALAGAGRLHARSSPSSIGA
jgi:asparagine synthase (glutamine-hydrolysing)